MSFVLRTLTTLTVSLALAATGALTAAADTPPAPSTPTPTATAAPTPTPAPSRTAPPTPADAPGGSDAQPTLAEMNASGDHTMGSTVPVSDPGSTRARALSGSAVQPLAASQPPGVQGLDVSGWQKLTMADWTRVWSNGGRFAYVKATESTDFISSQFTEQYNDSYRAGLVRGAYHFATPNTSSGAAQARYFVAHGGRWVNDGRTLPPLLDIEYNPYGATCYGKTAAAMVAWIRDFSTTMRGLTGRLPAIYSTTDWWKRCTGNNAGFGANPLIIARFPNSISSGAGVLPAGWSRYSMWQYANHGIFPGDQQVFNGTVAQLLALTRSGSTAIALDSPIVGVGDFNGDGKADLIARRGDGTLWFIAGTGKVGTSGGYPAAVRIGSGWNIFNAVIGAGDYNGDRKPDLLARKPDGTLWLYAGTGTVSSTSEGYQPGVQVDKGWVSYTQITAAGDFNGDGKADLLGRRADGGLWFFPGTGNAGATSSGHGAAVKIGSGWQVYTQLLGIGDQNRDGKPDLAGVRSDGSLYLYAGTWQTSGTNAWYTKGLHVKIAGITTSDSFTAPGDVNGDGITDLLARAFDGTLKIIPGYPLGADGYKPAVTIASGWSADTLTIDSGDFTGDGKADLLTRRTDGTLRLHAGTGKGTYGASVKIGSGWTIYTRITGAGDLNGDGHPDLVGQRSDGSLWWYAGTGRVGGGDEGYRPAVRIASGLPGYLQLVAGDFNGDRRPDLLGVRSNGTLVFLAGTASSTGIPAFRAPALAGRSGWTSYNVLISPGDLDSDGRADLVGRRADGTLWFYHGTGTMGVSGNGYATPTRIGTGWSAYRNVSGAHDATGDGRVDLVAIRSTGAVVSYVGTGNAGVPRFGYNSSKRIGTGWYVYQ